MIINHFDQNSDVIVIGAGHAGCEAALAAARMGCSTRLFSLSLDNIAQMSCNPAVGGVAKGHLVREIDALGGEMARNADGTGIQFRMLNMSKGPAVRALRVQSDRKAYRLRMQAILGKQEGLEVVEASVEQFLVSDSRILGVRTADGRRFAARAVILTTGTFLRGLIHIGQTKISAGRAGEQASTGLSSSLESLGFELGRLKTGTPPRLDGRTIDFSVMTSQRGDVPPPRFSHRPPAGRMRQVQCFVTHTNPTTHQIILNNLDRSPLYSGDIVGIGPRYCPSIEDKVKRFADRERHQVILEPDGLDTHVYYPGGISTSLPEELQNEFIHTIKGLESCAILRPGYAIEYDYVQPVQLHHTLETREIQGLYLAGQINGTSGYEEAAAQGLMAGINAALKFQSRPPLILGREEAYTGVLIDDLVTLGTQEPYRILTSRAEHRLLLRFDNADLRLMDKGYALGLIPPDQFKRFQARRRVIGDELLRLRETRLPGNGYVRTALREIGMEGLETGSLLSQVLKRQEMDYRKLGQLVPPPEPVSPSEASEIEVQIKYEGYIRQQFLQVKRAHRMEAKTIPFPFDYNDIVSLSREVREKLIQVNPRTIGQASRIPGMTPTGLSLLMVAVHRQRARSGGSSTRD